MDFNFKTLSEFNDYFKDERTCYEFLEFQRWGGEICCPHCGSIKKPYNVKPRGKFTDIPSYRCSERFCDLPFSVRTGTIFEGSKVELKKWFQAAYELSTAKKGISSVELSHRIGVSQKTAWFINHRLRSMLARTSPELLEGDVEIDETYVGGKNKNRHKAKKVDGTQGRSAKDKTPVLGILSRESEVVVKVVEDVSSATIKPIMVDNVKKGSNIHTDEWNAYKGLGKYYVHTVVNHNKGEYVIGNSHTNTIEGFWSLLKRGVVGTFHVVSKKHLQRYCDEFAYRYNNRDTTNINRFLDTLKRCDNTRLTYNALTSDNLDN